jgi:hypothetical protein
MYLSDWITGQAGFQYFVFLMSKSQKTLCRNHYFINKYFTEAVTLKIVHLRFVAFEYFLQFLTLFFCCEIFENLNFLMHRCTVQRHVTDVPYTGL